MSIFESLSMPARTTRHDHVELVFFETLLHRVTDRDVGSKKVLKIVRRSFSFL